MSAGHLPTNLLFGPFLFAPQLCVGSQGFQHGPFGRISSTLHFTVFQSLGGHASARRVLHEPCFRQELCASSLFGKGKRGHYERGLFAGGISRFSRASLEKDRILVCFPQSGVL